MQVQRSGAERPPATGWNGRSLLPHGGWGWASVGLFAIAAVGLASALVAMAVVGPGTWNMASTYIAFGGMAGAFLAGLFGIAFRHERSPLPIIVVAFGAMAMLFVGAEIGSSVLGFGH